jgi:hypothetical protein
MKYCQITKNSFKYFSSIYSSSVWLDKPLMRLPIQNIERISFGLNGNITKNQKNTNANNVRFILQIFISFNDSI